MEEADGTDHLVEPIADNEQQYRTFSWRWKQGDNYYTVRFLDSAQFMNASLEKLAENLTKESKIKTKTTFGNNAELMAQKGFFPYEWFDSKEKLYNTLPDITAFYSNLTGKGISKKDYEHVQIVWNTLGCKTMKDYMEAYLKSDVALLADIFEEFRVTSLNIMN